MKPGIKPTRKDEITNNVAWAAIAAVTVLAVIFWKIIGW